MLSNLYLHPFLQLHGLFHRSNNRGQVLCYSDVLLEQQPVETFSQLLILLFSNAPYINMLLNRPSAAVQTPWECIENKLLDSTYILNLLLVLFSSSTPSFRLFIPPFLQLSVVFISLLFTRSFSLSSCSQRKT